MSAWAALWLVERRRRAAAESWSSLYHVTPAQPSEALTAARARWEGKTVVCRDRGDSWWGRGHRHRVAKIDEGVPGDIVVSLECLDCERRGPVGLALMSGWEIVES